MIVVSGHPEVKYSAFHLSVTSTGKTTFAKCAFNNLKLDCVTYSPKDFELLSVEGVM